MATPRPARSPTPMRRGAETGEEVVLIEHERLERDGRRGGGPRAGIAFRIRKHERPRVGQFGGIPLDWNTGAAARFAPRPRGGARRRGTASHSNSTEVGTQHRNPASPQGTQGLGPRVMGAAGRQFGAQARSLPTRTAQLPLMRLCVHATTIPTSEPRPRGQVETPERDRARTAGRERISKGQATRRWGTRRISKGQATSRGGRGGSRRDTQQAAGDAADLEGTGRGGEQQGQSFGGPSASARKTEARPRQRAHRAGAWGWRGEPAPWQERRN